MHFVQSSNRTSWTHSYLESGHSYLPNDTDFGRIERQKKKHLRVLTSDEWETLIKTCKFNVTNMHGNFKDFTEAQKGLTFRKDNESSEKFLISQIKWMRVTESGSVMEYKNTNDPAAPIMKINFKKRGYNNSLAKFIPQKLYDVPIKLSLEKYKDLLDLLPYIPSVNHAYFNNLPHDNQRKNSNFENLPEDDDDDDE